MTSSRQSCLFVLSSAIEGVSAQSFMQAFTLAQTAFNVQLASPSGLPAEYVEHDDNSRRWINEFRSKSYSKPIKFEAVEASHYAAIFFPHAPGAVQDLPRNKELGNILTHFWQEKKLICAVGLGVAGLFSALRKDGLWPFKGFSLTAASVYELVRTPYFASLPVVPEDFIKDHNSRYCCSEPNAVHCVIDRHVITGQNEQSTVIAMQNLILMCSQKK